MAAIHVIGGVAVLGSYVWGLSAYPEQRDALWGGLPESVRGVYTANMFVAAVGYLAFAWHLFWRVNPEAVRVLDGRYGVGYFHAALLTILAPSALWMPLSLVALDRQMGSLVPVIIVVLALVAVGSLAMLVGLVTARPRAPGRGWAVAGAVAFGVQTVILDALIWPWFFM